MPCVEAALSRNADLLLVHHGIFWGRRSGSLGSFGALVRAYVSADLNLYAAHLALDAHPEVQQRRIGATSGTHCRRDVRTGEWDSHRRAGQRAARDEVRLSGRSLPAECGDDAAGTGARAAHQP
ncbi:MAG: Nif3-like dinuclear metal center hexameric protein [Anaerolineales bacterium]|nr:Nif3-like dinuclear metal center hexameric protein [Anaerolineales bacterium]